jgi:hypothetical protein
MVYGISIGISIGCVPIGPGVGDLDLIDAIPSQAVLTLKFKAADNFHFVSSSFAFASAGQITLSSKVAIRSFMSR